MQYIAFKRKEREMTKEEYKQYIVKLDELLYEIDNITEQIEDLAFEILEKIEQ